MFIWRNLTPAAIAACFEALKIEALKVEDCDKLKETSETEGSEDTSGADKGQEQLDRAVIEIQSRL